MFRRLGQLEEGLGVKLFERHRTGYALTPAGEEMSLLAERMEDVRSAALNFLVPAGCAYDPPGHRGVGSVLSEMITRGAGQPAP